MNNRTHVEGINAACPSYGAASETQLAHALFILEHVHDYLPGATRQLLIAEFLDKMRAAPP